MLPAVVGEKALDDGDEAEEALVGDGDATELLLEATSLGERYNSSVGNSTSMHTSCDTKPLLTHLISASLTSPCSCSCRSRIIRSTPSSS